MSTQYQFDILIIGSGAAGLSTALRIADDAQVAVLSKAAISEGSTNYAQGGISAVLDPKDSIESHIADTLNAGAGLCDPEVVRSTVKQGKNQIQWLLDLGMPFTRENANAQTSQLNSDFHLTREGGHSHRRVIHADDATGRQLSNTLIQQVRNHANISVFEHHIAVNLITRPTKNRTSSQAIGAYVLNRHSGLVEVFQAKFVILASGGASKVYLFTTNPDVSTGDGIAMAWRAGCRVANMEFIQFHPTCLYHPHAKSSLISEAVRGEGAKLLLPDGTRFMEAVDPRAELAPRDIVARAIDHEMKRFGLDCVYLDISFKPPDFVKGHFPNIYDRCLSFGFDITKEPIPVVPAAHYTCGGVVTDQNGRSDIDHLYVIGETAYTGLHGANRMASNSLLECLVFSATAVEDIKLILKEPYVMPAIDDWDESRVTDSDEEIVVAHNWEEIRRFMWDYVGIVRTNKRLERAMRRVNLLSREIDDYYSNFRVSNDLIELRSILLVSELIIRSAMSRKESRGLHYTLDYPNRNDASEKKNTILVPANCPKLDLPSNLDSAVDRCN